MATEAMRAERTRVEAARRGLDALLVDIASGGGGPSRPWRSERPPPLCAFQTLRVLGTRWRPQAELLREALVVYRIAVTHAISRYGATIVRGWLARASPGCADVTAPGGCPVPGSPLAGLPCGCYVPGWCEHRFLGPRAPVPRAPEHPEWRPLEERRPRPTNGGEEAA